MTASRSAAQQGGYALIAVLAALVLFSALAFSLAASTGQAAAQGNAEFARARAEAAAEAAVALVVHDLANADDAARAMLSGSTRSVMFAGTRLSLRLADERGKVPINRLDPVQVTRLLVAAGVADEALAVPRDSLLDWLDGDEAQRPSGAEAQWYRPAGYRPRNGALQSIEELSLIRGFPPALVERIRPWITVEPDAWPFDPTYATPTALAVMNGPAASGVAAIERARIEEGQQTAIALSDRTALVDRPMTIVIDAVTPDGGHVHREAVIALSGSGAGTFMVRRWR